MCLILLWFQVQTLLLCPICPHLAEHIWELIGKVCHIESHNTFSLVSCAELLFLFIEEREYHGRSVASGRDG